MLYWDARDIGTRIASRPRVNGKERRRRKEKENGPGKGEKKTLETVRLGGGALTYVMKKNWRHVRLLVGAPKHAFPLCPNKKKEWNVCDKVKAGRNT